MSCEIRSMMTSYFLCSSIRMPPIFTNSALTPSTFMELILSTNAGGNVFSIPNKIPIFFTAQSPFLICHPERSDCFAKRSNHAVEGSLLSQRSPPQLQGILPEHQTLPERNRAPPLEILPHHLQPQRPVMLLIVP